MKKLNDKGVGLIDVLLSIIVVGIATLIVSRSAITSSNIKKNADEYKRNILSVNKAILELYNDEAWDDLDGETRDVDGTADGLVTYKYKKINENIESLELELKDLPIKETLQINRYNSNMKGMVE